MTGPGTGSPSASSKPHPSSSVFRRVPYHPLAVAAYPVLGLLAVNLREVAIGVVVRPLVVALIAAVGLYLVWLALLRDRHRAALAASFLLVLFFSYGHLYQVLERAPVLGVTLGRHRFLLPFFGASLVAGLVMILRYPALAAATPALNAGALVLLAFPLVQIAAFTLRTAPELRAQPAPPPAVQPLTVQDTSVRPDIYYLILDTYTRADALQRDLGFDNSPFVEALQARGFYVAGCSRSNYSYTQGSLTSALNLDYLPALTPELKALGLSGDDIWVLLKHSRVRALLESMGYRTVAFETGYEWSRLADADIYLGPSRDPLALQSIQPFEAMLIKSTAALVLTDSPFTSRARSSPGLQAGLDEINFPHTGYIERQLFILEQLPQLAETPGPKFVFAHLLIPHPPFVFGPQGEIRSDPGFFTGPKSGPINDAYERLGYLGEVQFINARLLPIIDALVAKSPSPPVIILQGDHGLRKDNRLMILNAYLLPGDGRQRLYPSISPVNTFRVILDAYFGADLGRLPDESYLGDDPEPIPETARGCV